MFYVIGGELTEVRPDNWKFRNTSQVEVLGPFETEQKAYDVWKARAWATVDNAHMRFYIDHRTETTPDKIRATL